MLKRRCQRQLTFVRWHWRFRPQVLFPIRPWSTKARQLELCPASTRARVAYKVTNLEAPRRSQIKQGADALTTHVTFSSKADQVNVY